MPYVVDFENALELDTWSFDPDVWSLQQVDLGAVLRGQGDPARALEIVGSDTPEWVITDAVNQVVSMSILLDPDPQADVRLIVAGGASGYTAVRFHAGDVSISRGTGLDNLRPENETELSHANVPIDVNRWNRVAVWSQRAPGGVLVTVYVNNHRVAQALTPASSPGEQRILLQPSAFPILIDDLAVQRAEPFSTHFSEGVLLPSWSSSSPALTTVTTGEAGNAYLQVEGDVIISTASNVRPLQDVVLLFNTYVESGGMQINLRVNGGGMIRVEMRGGRLIASQIDGAGNVIDSATADNFYGVNEWITIGITLSGNRLEITNNGALRLAHVFTNAPAPGTIEIITASGALLRLDDVLVYEAPPVRSTVARAFDPLRLAAERAPASSVIALDFEGEPPPDLFESQFNAGTVSAGVLEITHAGSNSWRLINDAANTRMFGLGGSAAFLDSTDIHAMIDVRLDAPGTAWFSARTRANLMGEIEGFRMEVTRRADGMINLIIRTSLGLDSLEMYAGLVPQSPDFPPNVVRLEVVAMQDRIAFYVNDIYLISRVGVNLLGGSVGFGVEPNTTAYFDNLRIVDLTP